MYPDCKTTHNEVYTYSDFHMKLLSDISESFDINECQWIWQYSAGC